LSYQVLFVRKQEIEGKRERERMPFNEVDPNISVSQVSQLDAVLTRTGATGWNTLTLPNFILKGKQFEFEAVLLVSTTATDGFSSSFLIGFAGQNVVFQDGQHVGLIADTWSLSFNNGDKWVQGTPSVFTIKINVGEVITFKFGDDKAAVHVFKNKIFIGTLLGIPFATENLVPAVSLYQFGDSVSVKFKVFD